MNSAQDELDGLLERDCGSASLGLDERKLSVVFDEDSVGRAIVVAVVSDWMQVVELVHAMPERVHRICGAVCVRVDTYSSRAVANRSVVTADTDSVALSG